MAIHRWGHSKVQRLRPTKRAFALEGKGGSEGFESYLLINLKMELEDNEFAAIIRTA